MRLDSARGLKNDLISSIVEPMATSLAVRSAGLRAGPVAALAATPPSLALGVARKAKGEYVVAVRVQKRALETSPQIEEIRKKAKGEVDVQFIGAINKRAALPWYQKKTRPLKIGASIGHFKITAGTLGGFVRDRKTGEMLMLSNNHVFANENRAKKGDAILQPGVFDKGVNPADRVGKLLRFTRLKKVGANLVDSAVATLETGIKFDPTALTGIGKLTGVGDIFVDEGEIVHKVGRTTGVTRGRVTAFELDHVTVGYDLGVIRFDGQIEIEGADNDPFSEGGDSGSLIVDEQHRAVAQLFAGGTVGGRNGKGLTYASPIQAVLDALKVDLFLR